MSFDRKITRTNMFSKFILIFLILIGTIFIIFSFNIYLNAKHLINNGEVTEALITSIKEEGKGESATISVLIEYEVAGSKYYNELGTYIRGMKEGQLIDIRYLPEDPNTIILANNEYLLFWVFLSMGSIIIIIGVIFNYFYFIKRKNNLVNMSIDTSKVDYRNLGINKPKNIKAFISFFIFSICWFILIAIRETAPYGWILFGTLFFCFGLIAIIQRIKFDFNPKEIVIGELIELELDVNPDIGKTYRPVYKYIYKGNQEIYKSNISSFRFIKTKQIGEKEELLILIKDPKVVRINKKLYTFIEYFGCSIFILVGIAVILYQIFFQAKNI